MSRTSEEFYRDLGIQGLSRLKNEHTTTVELEHLKSYLKKEWKILDLACGYGRCTIPLSEMGYNISGADITPEFIEQARETAGKKDLKIDFRVADMRDLPYPDESFDAVICLWNSFSELISEADQKASLKEIYRILKEDGTALIEVRNHLPSSIDPGSRIGGVESMPSYKHTRRSIGKIVRRTGIASYSVRVENFGERKRLLLQIWKRKI